MRTPINQLNMFSEHNSTKDQQYINKSIHIHPNPHFAFDK